MGFQEFLDLLQRAGEERGALAPDSEELDDWVPLATVRDFSRALGAGMLKTMDATFPNQELADLPL